MPDTSRVEQVVRSAWERRLLVITVERAAIAAVAVLAAFVLMLLVGTQVLDWRWLVLLAIVGLGVAGYQIRQRLLSHYRVVQILDGRLKLADSLSTAWYLRKDARRGDDPIVEYQLQSAESAAQAVNVSKAFPFTGRRLWSIAGALALVAASLFSVRYFVTNSLSLRQSLIPLQLSDVFERHDQESDEAKRQKDEATGSDETRRQKTAPKAEGRKDAKNPERAEQPPCRKGTLPAQGKTRTSQERCAKASKDRKTKPSSVVTERPALRKPSQAKNKAMMARSRRGRKSLPTRTIRTARRVPTV